MNKYEDFVVTDEVMERLAHFNAHKGIMKYIRENGEEPPHPEEFYTYTDEELERAKRCAYIASLCCHFHVELL